MTPPPNKISDKVSDKTLAMLATLATLGPVGSSPAPGTIGSLLASLIGFALAAQLGIGSLVIATAIALGLGFPMAAAHHRITGKTDAPEVIIDEVAGLWLAMLAIPIMPSFSCQYAAWVAAAFILFRIFDILKPGPIAIAEKIKPQAAAVMADDILAGLIAGAILMLTAPLYHLIAP